MKKLKTTTILILLAIGFLACDEELAPPAFDTTTAKEKLLLRDWTYEYILIDPVTIVTPTDTFVVDTVRALTTGGEPQTTSFRDAIELRYMRYEKDHSYQSGWEDLVSKQLEYGVGDNYQPNFGYWHLTESEDTLIHNKLQTYEKRYEILELTENSFKRKLVGDRTSLISDGDRRNPPLDTITGTWIEVFVPRTITN